MPLAEKKLRRFPAAGLYVHIPFCVRKCPYCDFYSVTDVSLIPAFVKALCREAVISGRTDLRFDSLYLGGGTPSLLKAADIGRIGEAVRGAFDFLTDVEVTLEANPGTVDAEKLRDCRGLGVNRLNIGCQSFQDSNLKFLGRIHSAAQACRAIRQARRAGFDNIGLDLIYGLPGQGAEDWLSDLKEALSYEPEHLSCYQLTYEAGTPLARRQRRKSDKPLNENRCAELFEITHAFLEKNGYRPYEISNFARAAELQSRHNRKYWTLAPYIGLGPAAHSFVAPLRWWNLRDVGAYIDRLEKGDTAQEGRETLNAEQQMLEMILLGLRTTAGIDLRTFEEKTGRSFEALFEKQVGELEREGLARLLKKSFRLTRRGMLLLDSIVRRFV